MSSAQGFLPKQRVGWRIAGTQFCRGCVDITTSISDVCIDLIMMEVLIFWLVTYGILFESYLVRFVSTCGLIWCWWLSLIASVFALGRLVVDPPKRSNTLFLFRKICCSCTSSSLIKTDLLSWAELLCINRLMSEWLLSMIGLKFEFDVQGLFALRCCGLFRCLLPFSSINPLGYGPRVLELVWVWLAFSSTNPLWYGPGTDREYSYQLETNSMVVVKLRPFLVAVCTPFGDLFSFFMCVFWFVFYFMCAQMKYKLPELMVAEVWQWLLSCNDLILQKNFCFICWQNYFDFDFFNNKNDFVFFNFDFFTLDFFNRLQRRILLWRKLSVAYLFIWIIFS